MGMGKMMMLMLALSVAAIFIYRFYKNNLSDYTLIPQEMQVTYVPADFDYDFDDENTLAVLSNPHRYRREFDNLIYNFNVSMLHHVANRMNMADSLKSRIVEEYDEHHAYLRQLYFNDFIALRDTSAGMYETWYENGSTSAVKAMYEVASKYTCFLVDHVIMTLLQNKTGLLSVKGKKVNTPCAIAQTEGLKPMIERLEERAAIYDFSQSKGLMEEKVEKMIAELATVEVRDKKALNKTLQTKVWGYSVSSTDIEVSAISILKVGFKLNKFFEVKMNPKTKTLRVTLPEPEILSHEVFPKIDKLDIGWMRELGKVDFNENFNVLRAELRRDAVADNLMTKSKTQARELMSMMFLPVVKSINSKYKLEIKFRNINPGLRDTEIAEDFNEPVNNRSIEVEESIPYDN